MRLKYRRTLELIQNPARGGDVLFALKRALIILVIALACLSLLTFLLSAERPTLRLEAEQGMPSETGEGGEIPAAEM